MKRVKEWIKELGEDPKFRSQNLAIIIPAIQAEALREAARICTIDVEKLNRDAQTLDDLNKYLYETQAMAHQLDAARITAKADDVERGQA